MFFYSVFQGVDGSPLGYDTDRHGNEGRWVTVGAHPSKSDPKGGNRGGTPVFIKAGGQITAGPQDLAGRNIDQIDSRPGHAGAGPAPGPRTTLEAIHAEIEAALPAFDNHTARTHPDQQIRNRYRQIREDAVARASMAGSAREAGNIMAEAVGRLPALVTAPPPPPPPDAQAPDGSPAGNKPKKGAAKVKVNAPAITEAAWRELGLGVPVEHVSDLIGVMDESTVVRVGGYPGVPGYGGGRVSVEATDPRFFAARTIKRNHDGTLEIHNDLFEVKEELQGNGLGAEIFANQVREAAAAGVHKITCYAAGAGPPRRGEYNGYYTWARFGYNWKLSDHMRLKVVAAGFRPADTVQGLMMQEGGAEWWKQHGTGSEEATFDLTPGSWSMRVLEAYLAAKADQPPKNPTPAQRTNPPSTPPGNNSAARGVDGGPAAYRRPVWYEVRHAPPGGVTIQGRFFTGGQFIPAEVLAAATPEERAAVESGDARPKPLAPGPAAAPGGDVLARQLAVPLAASPGLTPEEAALEQRTQQYVRQHYPRLREAYLAKNGTFGADGTLKSVTLNTDEWRELVPGYVGTNSSATHEAASWLNNTLLQEMLREQAGKGNNTFMVLAGGGGSGKGTVSSQFFTAGEYPLVLDQVSDRLQKLEGKLDEAKSHGFSPNYVFVDRPPEGAADGIVGRALNLRSKGQTARTVNLAVGLKANIESRRTAIDLIKNRPDVPVRVVDNTGHGPRRLITDRAEALQYLEKRMAEDEAALAGGLADRLRADLVRRHAAGEIPDDMMDGFLGRGWQNPVGAAPPAHHARGGAQTVYGGPLWYGGPDGCKWVTIGAKPGAPKSAPGSAATKSAPGRHGGTPVCIKPGGEIAKGPDAVEGKHIGEVDRNKESPPGFHRGRALQSLADEAWRRGRMDLHPPPGPVAGQIHPPPPPPVKPVPADAQGVGGQPPDPVFDKLARLMGGLPPDHPNFARAVEREINDLTPADWNHLAAQYPGMHVDQIIDAVAGRLRAAAAAKFPAAAPPGPPPALNRIKQDMRWNNPANPHFDLLVRNHINAHFPPGDMAAQASLKAIADYYGVPADGASVADALTADLRGLAPARPDALPPHARYTPEQRAARRQQLGQAKIAAQKNLGGGCNKTVLATLEDGTKAVLKPVSGEYKGLREGIKEGTYHQREVAASAVAEVLGFGDLVPVVGFRTDPEHGETSAHEYVNDTAQVAANMLWDTKYTTPEDAARAAVFDYLVGHSDRHTHNWLVKDGKLVLIDNGLAFPDRVFGSDYFNTMFWKHAVRNGLPVPAEMAGLADKWPAVEQTLRAAGLGQGAIELTKTRFDAVVSRAGRPFGELPHISRPDQRDMQYFVDYGNYG